MLKHLARSVVAGTTALALAGGILAAPQVQAQVGPMKTTQMTVNMACNLQIDKDKSDGTVKNFAGAAEGVYNAGKYEQLKFTPSVTAPETVEANADFDYVISPGTVGAPGQLTAGPFTITVTSADQLNVWVDLPKNAKVNDVILEGGDHRVKHEIVNNRLRLYGKGLPNESNPATWTQNGYRGWKHGGLTASKQRVGGEDMVVVNLPKIRLKMTATGAPGSKIQPSFDTADANKFPTSAFAQMYAQATAKWGLIRANAHAMARCGLSDRDGTSGATTKPSDSFPAVTITERSHKAQALVKVLKYNGEPVAKGTAVDITVDGAAQKITVGDNGVASLPEVTLKEGATKDVAVALADHPEVKQTVTLKGQATAQPEAERTATLTLPRKSYPATLRVLVKDYLGNPIPGAEVKAGEDVVKADSNGVAVVERTVLEDASESVTVVLVGDESVTATAELTGKKDAAPVEVTLQKEAQQVESKVSVTVIDTNGNVPPAGTQVALKKGEDVFTATTDDQGNVEFTTTVTEGSTVPAKVYLVAEESSFADITLTPGGTAKAELFLTVSKDEEPEEPEAPTDVTRRAEITVKRITGDALPAGTKVDLLINGEPETGTVNKDGVIVITRQLKSNENLDLNVALASAPDTVKSTRLFGGSDRVGSVQLVMEAQELEQKIIIEVKNFDGSLVAGESVDMLIDASAHTLTTDSKGRATFPVTVTEGQDKTFQVALKDNPEAKQAAVVTAQPGAAPARVTLTRGAIDVEMPVRVTVRDEDGKPAANEQVELLIDGTSHTATSSSEGVATFAPRLTEGQRATAKIRVVGEGGTPANVVLVGKRNANPVQITVTKGAAPVVEEPETPPTTDEPGTEEPDTPDTPNEPGDKSSTSSLLPILFIILGTLLGGLGLGAALGWAKDAFNLPF